MKLWIFVVLLIFIQVVLLGLTIYYFYRHPFDIGNALMIMYFVFYSFPAWDLYFDWGLFDRNILNYSIGLKSETQGLYLIFITTMIMLSYYIGHIISLKFIKGTAEKKNKIKLKDTSYNIKRINFFIKVLSICWIVVFLYLFTKYNQSILLFFSPSRKEGLFESSYISLIYLNLPLLILILIVLKNHVLNRKISKVKMLYLLITTFLIYMTSGQRREIIDLFIFIFVLLTHLKVVNIGEIKKFNQIKYKRKKIFQIGALSILLVPLLWWSRVFFTQLQRNDNNVIMPWERRGFIELLFGSSSGGFNTLLLGLDHKRLFNLEWGYSVYFFITSFIPRGLLENKPIIINKLWEQDLNLIGNPSTFFINEMYINFGIASIFFSFIFGLGLSYFYNKLYYSKDVFYNIYSYTLFSSVILLFKNGFTQFIINTLITLILFHIVYIFIKKRGSYEKNNYNR